MFFSCCIVGRFVRIFDFYIDKFMEIVHSCDIITDVSKRIRTVTNIVIPRTLDSLVLLLKKVTLQDYPK